jgi:cysteine synthase
LKSTLIKSTITKEEKSTMTLQTFTPSYARWDAYQRILELEHLVGKTPLQPIRKLFNKPGVEVFVKLEWQQFGGSVKARAGL